MLFARVLIWVLVLFLKEKMFLFKCNKNPNKNPAPNHCFPLGKPHFVCQERVLARRTQTLGLAKGGRALEPEPFGRLWGRVRVNQKVDALPLDTPALLVGASRLGVHKGNRLGAPRATLEPKALP